MVRYRSGALPLFRVKDRFEAHLSTPISSATLAEPAIRKAFANCLACFALTIKSESLSISTIGPRVPVICIMPCFVLNLQLCGYHPIRAFDSKTNLMHGNHCVTASSLRQSATMFCSLVYFNVLRTVLLQSGGLECVLPVLHPCGKFVFTFSTPC